MRVYGKKVDVDEEKLLSFFNDRGKKHTIENPQVTVMYQDNHPELATKRDLMERTKITPLLHITEQSTILDIGCGIGRWLDSFNKYESYLGADFSPELIKIANERFTNLQNVKFEVLSVQDIATQENFFSVKFSTVIFSGVMQYINDDLLYTLFNKLIMICKEKSEIYIRCSIAMKERLILSEEWSSELNSEYSAIYRTYDECMMIIGNTLIKNGFKIESEGLMYSDNTKLNNRIETTQYYFILKRVQ
ncbi:class I SAM-dependent methyltransferase [Lysinibacillus fusiformis]